MRVGKVANCTIKLKLDVRHEQSDEFYPVGDRMTREEFYNRLLCCFVVIELKTEKLTHQDLGQLQMYVNYYDRVEKLPDVYVVK